MHGAICELYSAKEARDYAHKWAGRKRPKLTYVRMVRIRHVTIECF